MKNLSWLFYKGYYQGFQHWNNFEKPNEHNKKQIANFFAEKNNGFLDANYNSFNKIKAVSDSSSSTFKLATQYPGLIMGTGYSHGIGAIGEFKIGFHLDYVTGLPVIPGSSVKGVIRSAFPIITINKKTDQLELSPESVDIETTKAKWILALIKSIDEADFLTKTIQPMKDDIDNQKLEFLNKLILEIFEGVKDVNKTDAERKYFSIYDRNVFFDALPIRCKANKLYGSDSITPHPDPLKNPVPLLFLKVLPKVTYEFNFRIVSSIVEQKLTKENLKKLFQKIILEYGIGAKTNVGYGQLEPA